MTRTLKTSLSFALFFLLLSPSYSGNDKDDSLMDPRGFSSLGSPNRTELQANSATGEEIYSKGHVFLDAGLHLGVYRYGYGGAWNSLAPMIPITANVEVAAMDFVGIGGYFGFATRSFEYEYQDWDKKQGPHTDTYKHRYTYTSFGAKGLFHVIPFLDHLDLDHGMDGSKYDLYIAHYLGVRLSRSKWVDDIEDGDEDDVKEETDTDVGISILNPTVGARYMFTDFFGAYAELGYGHWSGTGTQIGLSFRF